MSIDYTKVEDGELFKWDKVGQKLEGVLQSYNFRKDTGKGPGHVYEVKTKNGIAPFFAPSLLHKKLKGIGIGNIVDIEFTGQQKTASGNTVKLFNVQFAKPTEANLKAVGVEVFETVTDDDNGSDQAF